MKSWHRICQSQVTEKARWATLMALLLLTPLAFYPGLLSGQLPLLHPWESGYSEFLRAETVSQVLNGQAPLWSSAHLAGVPLVEDPRSALASPQSWLTWLFGVTLARGASAWLFTALAGLGTLLWGRCSGLAPGAALAAAVLAQANPGLHLGLIDGTAATIWLLPWCLFALERGWKGGGPWLSLAVAAVLCGGDLVLGAWILAMLVAYWLQRGAKARTLLSILGGVLLSAPLTLPALAAWVSGDGVAAQVWPEGLYGLGLVVVALGALLAWPSETGRRWLGGGALALGLALVPLLFGGGALLGALMPVALWMLAVACGFAVHHWVPERGQAGVGAAALVFGVLCCGPLRALGEAPTLAVDALPSGRTLGVEAVPLMQSELRGAPLWPSPQAQRFGAMLDPDAQESGLWVGSINAQNRKVLEFAGAQSVVAQGTLFGLAPLGSTKDADALSVYGLDGGPGAWLTPGARSAANEREALDFLRTGYAFREAPAVQDLERRLPTEGVITPLEIQDFGAQVRIAISAGSPSGVLVLADRWEPEWQVQVDGQDAELLQVGGLFRGVMLPTGAKEVVFEYRLWTWGWGLGLGGIGLLLSLGMALRRPE